MTTLTDSSPDRDLPAADDARRLPGEQAIREAVLRVHEPLSVIEQDGGYGVAHTDSFDTGPGAGGAAPAAVVGYVPAIRLENLGSASFCEDHGLKYAYVAGAMVQGICSADIVVEMGRAGMVGFFGAGGLSLAKVEEELARISDSLGELPFGSNLLHSPNEPGLEDAVVDLYLRRGVSLVSASAYLDLTLPVVRYRVHGIHRDEAGRVVTPNRVIAKVSRVEVASKFLSPPPEGMLAQLVDQGAITDEQARMAAEIPMAQDITAEADSGGHTDNRPALALIPTMLALRDQMQEKHQYHVPLRVGAAGGISTPASAAAAFAMGAAYILTGTVNQACVESGTSDTVREMLAGTQQADIMMAPAADMFEMGVRVQVLKRGTMFGMRATKLYELYRAYSSIYEIPPRDRATLEKGCFRASLEDIWRQTEEFFSERDPSQIQRAEREPKHRMALIFRWYLGNSSRWANSGEPSRVIDYQVCCGPAMGAFNEWVQGSFLERPENRKVVPVAMNILYGAAVQMRANMLSCQGVRLASDLLRVRPLELRQLQERLNSHDSVKDRQ